jgi:UDP-glucose 4-epimerase
MNSRILVTGGAGYIGSHTVRGLRARGHEVVVLDDLSEGHAAAVPKDVELLRVDLRRENEVLRALAEKKPRAVFHFAANCLVGESVADPGKYYRNNLEASLVLLRCMRETGCETLVFSSTAATYGEPVRVPISEDHPCKPINPYGATKLMFEQALSDHALAHGFRWVALRYFNAAGAAASGDLGEDHDPESHLIPLILAVALGKAPTITIFGEDYPTEDGTCVRDYIHVEDLAQAHILALEHMDGGGTGGVFNLGTGEGATVRRVIQLARKITGRDIREIVGKRRPGDPAVLVADGRRAQEKLGWRPQHSDLETIVASAWRWHERHPNGYGDGPTR